MAHDTGCDDTASNKSHDEIDWSNTASGFFCLHRMKAVPQPQFLDSCLSITKFHEMPPSPQCPKHIYHMGLCIDCAVHLLISTNFCTIFEDNLSFMKMEEGIDSNKTVSELERFREIEHEMNLFVDIISIPSILEFVLNHNHNLFAKCIRLLTALDEFYRVYKGFVDPWMARDDPSHSNKVSLAVFNHLKPSHVQGDKLRELLTCSKCTRFDSMIAALRNRSRNGVDKHLRKAIGCKIVHLQDHITESVWDSHDKLHHLMNALYHRAKSLDFLVSILNIDEGYLMVEMVVGPFLEMARYHKDIDECFDPPLNIYYFAIHVSLLLFRFRKKLKGIAAWNKLFGLILYGNMMTVYWETVRFLFKNRENKIKKVYLSQIGLYCNDVVEHRERIHCGNGECNVNYYQHRYGTHAFAHWDSPKIGDWYRCKGCKVIYYCSRRCQKMDWNKGDHKRICRRLIVNSC